MQKIRHVIEAGSAKLAAGDVQARSPPSSPSTWLRDTFITVVEMIQRFVRRHGRRQERDVCISLGDLPKKIPTDHGVSL
jgi:hypothetical protein